MENCVTLVVSYMVQKHSAKRKFEERAYLKSALPNVNGTLRKLIESWKPAKYVGVDIQKGPSVDVVCSLKYNKRIWGRKLRRCSFNGITRNVYHRDWRKVISNIKKYVNPAVLC